MAAELISRASHEIRSPLTALQGFTEILLSRDVPPDKQREWLGLVNQEAVRLSGITEDLLDVSRVNAGGVALKAGPVRLREVVCRVVRVLDREGQRVRLAAPELPLVTADGDKLAQVVTNLVRNALDYSPAKEPVAVEVANRCLAPVAGVLVVADGPVAGVAPHSCRDAVSVAVRDRGVGVRAEELCRVFEPFYRAEGTRAALPGGSGLGLSIAKAIVQRHGGCLWGHSPPGGRGSTFGFCLPRGDEET